MKDKWLNWLFAAVSFSIATQQLIADKKRRELGGHRSDDGQEPETPEQWDIDAMQQSMLHFLPDEMRNDPAIRFKIQYLLYSLQEEEE